LKLFLATPQHTRDGSEARFALPCLLLITTTQHKPHRFSGKVCLTLPIELALLALVGASPISSPMAQQGIFLLAQAPRQSYPTNQTAMAFHFLARQGQVKKCMEIKQPLV
jgi:hypothetical protein